MTFLFREQLPLDEAMYQAVAWNDIHNLIPSPEEEIIKDKIIRAWTKCIRGFQVSPVSKRSDAHSS